MANSQYEYVKDFEVDERLSPSWWIVVRIDGCHFHRFSAEHAFEKPNDESALNLMNVCARSMLEQFSDIVFAYEVRGEYSFIWKETTRFYERRASKLLSLCVSYFSSTYAMKWKEFFPQKDLTGAPYFDGQVVCYSRAKFIRDYLAWRQVDCHINNQCSTCFWMLVVSGKTQKEVQECLKGTQTNDKNELLFEQFNVNCGKLPQTFRKGSCVYREQVKEFVKLDNDGNAVRRSRRKVFLDHMEIVCPKFSSIFPTGLLDSMKNSKYKDVKKFEVDDRLCPSYWIVLRIDGCHFHRFSAEHAFEKPNDESALNLMNACAMSMLEQFPDIVFAYGVSDEYSLIWKESTQFCERRTSKLLSLCVSYFTSTYVMKWKEFFPQKDLIRVPYFDGRVVCYPRAKFIRDYLAWRQVDCHINNQYNTCFWMLVKSGKSEKEAQECLKGTQTKDKNELLFEQFNVNYDKLPQMFRKGSCVYREQVVELKKLDSDGNAVRRSRRKVVLDHMDIIDPKFWSEHPYILEERK